MSEELQQEASASLAAGFNKVRGDQPPAETPEPTAAPAAPTEEQAPETTPEPTPQPTAAPEEEFLDGMSKSQVKELLARVPDQAKAIEKLHGKIGELVRTIKQSQPAAEQPGSEGAPARRLQADALKRLQVDYPDIAEALAEDLSALMPTTTAPDPKQFAETVQQMVAKGLEEGAHKTERKLLSRAHPDWEKTIHTPDFKLWLEALPDPEQEEFNSSWESDVVGGFLDKFKTHRESLAKQRQRSNARLEAAVVPKGDGGAATSKLPDSAGLSVGFKRVRGGP